MSNDSLKPLVAQGLAAMKVGGEIAARATDEIGNDASSPDLKAALDEGNRTARQWAERVDRALSQVGSAGGDGQDNPVLEAHYEVSRRIRQAAPDDAARDLGIVAAGQLALHYWIAAFGTMANYTRHLGLDDVARDMKASVDEARQADERHTALAEQLLGKG